MNQSKEMAKMAYTALSDKKGEDIRIIDIRVSIWQTILSNGNNASRLEEEERADFLSSRETELTYQIIASIDEL